MASHPDDHLLQLFGERPAILVTDPNTAGVYDTVYVDLDDDYQFGDEKPVTKSSPASYRDMNGDGYTDLSGGLLYFISDGETVLPGGVMRFTEARDRDAFTSAPARCSPGRATTTPRSGTRDADRVQHPRPGRRQRPRAVLRRPRRPAGRSALLGRRNLSRRRIGGAPKAKGAPFGDIYFSFEFSTQFGYLLATRHGIDVTSNSYGSSAADNDGYDAASQEADFLYNGTRTTPVFSTATARPASARRPRRSRWPASRSAPPRSSAAPAGTRSRTRARS